MSIQQDAIKCITEGLTQDNRVKAMFLKGSIAREEEDKYSDVDYYCIVDESGLNSFLSDRMKIMEVYKRLIYNSISNFGDPQIVGVFDNGLHFDLYTLIKAPNIGTDSIKILYDPENMLNNYKRIQKNISAPQVAEFINEFSFRLIEFEAAYCRHDILWASRLGSFLINDVSQVLSYVYEKNKPFIGMKRLYQNLPNEFKYKMAEANNKMTSDDIINAIKILIDIIEKLLSELEGAIVKDVNKDFLNFVKLRIGKL